MFETAQTLRKRSEVQVEAEGPAALARTFDRRMLSLSTAASQLQSMLPSSLLRVSRVASLASRSLGYLRWSVSCTVYYSVLCLMIFGSASAAESGVTTIAPSKAQPPLEIGDQVRQYDTQIRAFVAYNAARLRSGPLLRPAPVFGFSPLKGITPSELATVKSNLAHFGVDATPSGAKPNFLFVTPVSADDLRKMLVDLGVPKEYASVEWSIFLQTSDACFLQTLDDLSGAPGELALAVARASSAAKPAVCLNNTVLNAMGLYKSLEQFSPVKAGPLSRWVDADFIDRVSHCKTFSKIADAIADCVLASYSFPAKS